jgi:demethylmenaquinone methyltransferase/2-methoxy-6-polyprenyl-1,4-benzoquinol methylase
MTEIQDMTPYYRERAPVYDAVYGYPERQADLRFLESHVAGIFRGHHVLEVAAGTGYWTQFISKQAKSILAADREPAQLEELERRDLHCNVEPRVLDAFHMDRLVDEGRSFSAAFAGLWLSHVPKQRMLEFFCALHQCLKPGATVVLLDNSAVQCKRLPISHQDEFGNTYQQRTLDSGNSYSVLKNFPDLDELKDTTAPFGEFKNYIDLENFWLFQYVSTR